MPPDIFGDLQSVLHGDSRDLAALFQAPDGPLASFSRPASSYTDALAAARLAAEMQAALFASGVNQPMTQEQAMSIYGAFPVGNPIPGDSAGLPHSDTFFPLPMAAVVIPMRLLPKLNLRYAADTEFALTPIIEAHHPHLVGMVFVSMRYDPLRKELLVLICHPSLDRVRDDVDALPRLHLADAAKDPLPSKQLRSRQIVFAPEGERVTS